MPASLGEFEVLILLAVLRLADDAAYPPAIRTDIEQRAGRSVQRGAVYVTLDRLESKGLLTSRVETAAGAEPGRPRRFYRISPKGLRAVRRALHAVEQMRAGLESHLGGKG